MVMPGRSHTSGTGYRYGFNGKENDNEVKGNGNQQDYGMRVYDSRFSKFLSLDPLQAEYPWWSPYQFAGNSPLRFIDLDGKETYDYVLDLNDKGHKIDSYFRGTNTHGLNGFTIWDIIRIQIPAVDVYQNGKFIARYSFNIGAWGGFKDLNKFLNDEEFRNQYMSSNSSVEENNQKRADDIGNQFKEGFENAAIYSYAYDRSLKIKDASTIEKQNNIPGKRNFTSESRVVQHTFKHASDFGITGNWSKLQAQKFEAVLNNHVQNTKPISGTYRGVLKVNHYFDPKTNLNVMVDQNDKLVGAWKLSKQQIKNLKRNGNVQ